MYPELARIELFARGTRPGWAAWGNQAGVAA
jgi:N6-adenosine-specific RNA methylase IME4